MTEENRAFLEALEQPETPELREEGEEQEAEQSRDGWDEPDEKAVGAAEALCEEVGKEPVIRCEFQGEEKLLPLSEAVLWMQRGMEAAAQAQRGEQSREMQLIDYLAARSGMEREAYLSAMEQGRMEALEAEQIEAIRSRYPDIPEALAKEAGAALAREKERELSETISKGAQREREAALSPWVEFAKAFPEIESVETLPEEVLAAIDGGASPAAAMQAFEAKRLAAENAQLRAALDALERNERNRHKSVGSMIPSGGNSPADPFLMGLL